MTNSSSSPAARWPQLKSLLDAEIAYRCRQVATGGLAALFADLDGRVSWSAGLLQLDYRHPDTDDPVAGRGVALTPSAFIHGANMQMGDNLVVSRPASAWIGASGAVALEPPDGC